MRFSLDQASGLRELVDPDATLESTVQVVAVASGKGGVGKTNIVANLAIAAAQSGRRVMVMDADLALGNLDVLLGLTSPYTLEDVLFGHRSMDEVIVKGPAGIRIIPGTTGVQELTALTHEQQLQLQQGFLSIAYPPDLLLIDCAAGISSNVLYFSLVAHDVLVVVNAQPTSLTDAYALIKVLSTRHQLKRFRILVNMVKSDQAGKGVFRKLSKVTDRFLQVSLDYAGWIPADEHVSMAVCRQQAVVEAFPKAPSSRAFATVTRQVSQWKEEQPLIGGVQLFSPAMIGLPGGTEGLGL